MADRYNIPVPHNDLNRDGNADDNWMGATVNAVKNWWQTNSEWTPSKDLFVRFTVPLLGMAATAFFKKLLDDREKSLSQREKQLLSEEQSLEQERRYLEQAQFMSSTRPLGKKIAEIEKREQEKADKAIQEIDLYQPMIRKILKIRCAPFTPRKQREPLQQEIRGRLLQHPTPFDHYGDLKESIFKGMEEIYQKDVEHCDLPPPLGKGDNGELYKLYRDNWKLKVELSKYKNVIEELKVYIVD